MPFIVFTDNLTRHLDCPPTEVPVGTVRTALDEVFRSNARLRSYLLDDQGRLRRHVVVFVNGREIADRDGLTDPLGAADEVYVFQALSGG